jgi:predicted RNA-binding protein YlqC (UPF0109 family)
MIKVQHSESGTYNAADLIPEECKDLTLEQVLTLLVTHIVAHPEQVSVHIASIDRLKTIEFEILPDDMAQLLGSKGYTANAIRTISKAILGPLVKEFTYRLGVQAKS